VTQFGAIDFAIVSVKTYSLSQIAPLAAILTNNGALVLPLLNGVDIAERLIEHGVPKENILDGRTTVSAQGARPPSPVGRRSRYASLTDGELDGSKVQCSRA